MWVPSRIGITGNEMADKTAKLLTRTIFHPTSTEIPINDIRTPIKHNTNTARQCY